MPGGSGSVMAGKPSTIDIEAFEALDRQRLLRVLRRVLTEEAAGSGSGAGVSEREKDVGRGRVFRNLVSMIQEMMDLNDPGWDGKPPKGRLNGA
jgi:hypothetical protein